MADGIDIWLTARHQWWVEQEEGADSVEALESGPEMRSQFVTPRGDEAVVAPAVVVVPGIAWAARV
ncbi:MAG: hypothetical protein JKY37_28290 [Nannocystaceae bacterium]|nr:hypothetical protein [Nannocystaceae bacterium]